MTTGASAAQAGGRRHSQPDRLGSATNATMYALILWDTDYNRAILLSARRAEEDFLSDAWLYPGLWLDCAGRLALGQFGFELDALRDFFARATGEVIRKKAIRWCFGPDAPGGMGPGEWRARKLAEAGLQHQAEWTDGPATAFLSEALVTSARLAELVGVDPAQVGVWHHRGELPDPEPWLGQGVGRVPVRIWWLPRILHLIPQLRKRLHRFRQRGRRNPSLRRRVEQWIQTGRQLTVRDVAAELNVSEEYVRRAIRQGHLRATRRGGAYQVDPMDLLGWINERGERE
ncbi:MAG TPA: helix-turn-helix domain-containing protein [Thermaerobacter sp.]